MCFKSGNKQYGLVRRLFFNISKGYGFIIEDGSEAEHFVHSTGLVDQINEGDSVEFELVDGKKGKKAGNVKRIS